MVSLYGYHPISAILQGFPPAPILVVAAHIVMMRTINKDTNAGTTATLIIERSGRVKGLIIADPWIGYIISGTKTWEMRSRNTTIRGRIALIRKGSCDTRCGKRTMRRAKGNWQVTRQHKAANREAPT